MLIFIGAVGQIDSPGSRSENELTAKISIANRLTKFEHWEFGAHKQRKISKDKINQTNCFEHLLKKKSEKVYNPFNHARKKVFLILFLLH